MKDIIKDKVVDLIKNNNLECIILDDVIAVRKEGHTLFFIEFKLSKQQNELLEITPENILDKYIEKYK